MTTIAKETKSLRKCTNKLCKKIEGLEMKIEDETVPVEYDVSFAGHVLSPANPIMLYLGTDKEIITTTTVNDLSNSVRLKKSQLLSITYELENFTNLFGRFTRILVDDLGLSFDLPNSSGVLDVSSSNIILDIYNLISVSTNITGGPPLPTGETSVTLRLRKL